MVEGQGTDRGITKGGINPILKASRASFLNGLFVSTSAIRFPVRGSVTAQTTPKALYPIGRSTSGAFWSRSLNLDDGYPEGEQPSSSVIEL